MTYNSQVVVQNGKTESYQFRFLILKKKEKTEKTLWPPSRQVNVNQWWNEVRTNNDARTYWANPKEELKYLYAKPFVQRVSRPRTGKWGLTTRKSQINKIGIMSRLDAVLENLSSQHDQFLFLSFFFPSLYNCIFHATGYKLIDLVCQKLIFSGHAGCNLPS